MKETIRNIIARFYRKAILRSVEVDNETIYLKVENANNEWLSKRLLDRFSDIRWVYIARDNLVSAYSRETLRWLGYYTKI